MAVRAGKKKKASPQSRSKQVRKAHVVIVRTASNDKFSLLGIALERAGFWPHIDAARRRAGIPGEGFQVLIKPDLHLSGTAVPQKLWSPMPGACGNSGWRIATCLCGPSSSATTM